VTNFPPGSTRSPGNRGAEIFTQPIEIILRFNAGIVNAFQSATVSWMQRRQEAARDTIDSFEKLVCCRDIGEAMTIQREWVKRSMHRLDKDLSPLADQAPDMVHENAVVDMLEAAQLPSREAGNHARAAKTCPLRRLGNEEKRSAEPSHKVN